MIIRGKDKGETGTIKRVIRSQNRVIIEGKNLVSVKWFYSLSIQPFIFPAMGGIGFNFSEFGHGCNPASRCMLIWMVLQEVLAFAVLLFKG